MTLQHSRDGAFGKIETGVLPKR